MFSVASIAACLLLCLPSLSLAQSTDKLKGLMPPPKVAFLTADQPFDVQDDVVLYAPVTDLPPDVSRVVA